MPTVLHYVGYDEDEGGVLSVVRGLAACGQFDCQLGVNAGFVQRREPRLPLLELPRISGDEIGPVQAWRAHAVALAVRRWLRAEPGRVFHGHSRAGLLVALWLASWGESRVVASVHCYGRHRWFYRLAARRLRDRLFWLSPAMVRHYGLSDDAALGQCIPGGVPGGMLAPAPPPSSRLRLGGAGSLVPWKNWPLVIEALALLPDDVRTRVTFQHVGGGPPEAFRELQERIARHRLEQQVVFCGAEPSADRLLANIDALVVASYNEPFSMSMLEALDAGVPVLAADSGGAIDIIRDGANGRLFRTGDARSLARVICGWLEQPPSYDRQEIRRTSVRAADMATQWLGIYARLTLPLAS